MTATPSPDGARVVHVHLSSGHQLRCLMTEDDARRLVDDLGVGDGSTLVSIPSTYSEVLAYRRSSIIGVRLHHGEEEDAEAARERLADALNEYTTHSDGGEEALQQIGGLDPAVVDVVVSWITEAGRR